MKKNNRNHGKAKATSIAKKNTDDDKSGSFVATFDDPVEILQQDPFEIGGVQYDD